MSETKKSGINFSGALQILFIGLKLTHYINWSWWWVMAPTWMPLALILVLLILSAIIQIIDSRI